MDRPVEPRVGRNRGVQRRSDRRVGTRSGPFEIGVDGAAGLGVRAGVIDRDGVASDGDPEAKIRNVVQVFLEQYRANPQGFKLVERAIDDHSPTVHTLAERWFSRAHLAIQTITTQGIEDGIFKPLPPHSIPFVIIGIIIHTLRANQLIDRIIPGFSGPELLASLADVVLTLLRTGDCASVLTRHTQKKKRVRTA